MATLQLRPARLEDIPAIMEMERIPEYRSFVGNWSFEEHREKLTSEDCHYFAADDASGKMAGFAILRGLASPHGSIRLQRIVVADAGAGIGRSMLAGILEYVFRERKAHRLWLDVFEINTRAQHVYESLGFRREGVLREAIFRDGEYHTQVLMSMLDREFESLLRGKPEDRKS